MFEVQEKETGKKYLVYGACKINFETYFLIYDKSGYWWWGDARDYRPVNDNKENN